MAIFQIDDLNMEIKKHLLLKDRLKLVQCNKEYYNYLSDDIIKEYRIMINKRENIKDIFKEACYNNLVNLAKYWKENSGKRKNKYYKNIFMGTCALGQLDTAQWLYSLNKIVLNTCRDLIYSISCNNHIEVGKWLYSLGVKPSLDSFKIACRNGHMEIVKWIYSLEPKIYIDGYTMNEVFQNSCNNGHIEVMKWLYSIGKIKTEIINKMFISSCIDGRIEIMKWLYTIDNIDISKSNVFIISCESNYIEIAEWLYSLGINIHLQNNAAFKAACKYDNIGIVKWLYSIDKIDMDNPTDYREILIRCIMANSTRVIEWLNSMKLISIDYNIIEKACLYNRKIEMVKYLESFCDTILYDTKENSIYNNLNNDSLHNTFVSCCRNGYLDIAKWLYSKYKINIYYDNNAAFRTYNNNVSRWLYTIYDIDIYRQHTYVNESKLKTINRMEEID